jgi:hypothetical protein
MMIRLIDMKFDNSILADMREYLRVHSGKYLHTLLYVNNREWNYHNIKSMYSPSAAVGFYTEADVDLEVTENELVMLHLEGKYIIKELDNVQNKQN